MHYLSALILIMAMAGASTAQPSPTAPKSTGFADSPNTKKQKIDRKLIKTLASKSTWNGLPSIPSINLKNKPIGSGGFGIIRSPAELSSNPSLAEKSQKSIETFLNHKTIDWSKEMIVLYVGHGSRLAQNEQLLREVVQLEDGCSQICLTDGPDQKCYACPSMIAIVEKCEGKLIERRFGN